MRIKLDNGRSVISDPTPNGGHDIMMADGGDMSDAEWEEYREKFREEIRKQDELRLASRLANGKLGAKGVK